MIKLALVGWFFIAMADKDGDKYNYLLEDKATNTFIALRVDKPLEYKVNTWGKFKIQAECDVVKTSTIVGDSTYWTSTRFCNADSYELIKCRRPFYVGGVMYCE